MCGYMRLDRIRNEVIRDQVEIAPIEDKMMDKMMETRLRWFDHVKRKRVECRCTNEEV